MQDQRQVYYHSNILETRLTPLGKISKFISLILNNRFIS